MEIELRDFDDTRLQVLAALVHQSRQPLFVLQNYLSSMKHLSERLPDIPETPLLQICILEMRSAVDTLQRSLSQLAKLESQRQTGSGEANLSEFLEETIQIARFCAFRCNARIICTYESLPADLTVSDPSELQLELVQWILDVCRMEAPGEGTEFILTLSVSRTECGITMKSAGATTDREMVIVRTRAEGCISSLDELSV